MKILKHTGKYLENNVKFCRNVAILLLLIGIGGIIGRIPFFLIPLIVGWFFLRKSTNYQGGLDGENLVRESLQNLSDNYSLINDIKLPDCRVNIDHVVLGPNGVFIIETKNYNGQLINNGDEWIRHYEGGMKISMKGQPYWQEDRDYDLGSPCKQVKRGTVKIKQIIESSNIFKKPLNIWVQGIVVFTNPNVELQLTNTTVPILKIEELNSYIKSKISVIKFSPQELESIGKAILMRAETD